MSDWDFGIVRDLLSFYTLSKRLKRAEAELEKQAALITSLQQELKASQDNYAALAAKPSRPNAEFVGWYSEPTGLMPKITLFLKEMIDHVGDKSVVIATDFAAYGAITWNEQFNQQEQHIRTLCKQGENTVNRTLIIVNSYDTNKTVIENQFTDAVFSKEYRALVPKLEKWVKSDVFASLAADDPVDVGNLGKIRKAIKDNLKITKRLFIDSYLDFNERLVERYRDSGGKVFQRDSFVPLHGWFYNIAANHSTEGIIGIVDVKAVWNEPGFRVRDDVAVKIMLLINELSHTSNGK